jgi:hypothetical protein
MLKKLSKFNLVLSEVGGECSYPKNVFLITDYSI